MGLSSFGVETLADDPAVADDDAADHGVRAGVPGRRARQLHAPPDVVPVHVARAALRLAPQPPAAAHGHEAGAARGGGVGVVAGRGRGARGEAPGGREEVGEDHGCPLTAQRCAPAACGGLSEEGLGRTGGLGSRAIKFNPAVARNETAAGQTELGPIAGPLPSAAVSSSCLLNSAGRVICFFFQALFS